MKTENLKELRSLRNTIKAAEARINQISDAATTEAVTILAAQGKEKGEFEVEGVGTFQLQRTDVFYLADYHKYKEPEAVAWRAAKKKRESHRAQASAQTAIMASQMDAFVKAGNDKEPDEVKLTVKCVD